MAMMSIQCTSHLHIESNKDIFPIRCEYGMYNTTAKENCRETPLFFSFGASVICMQQRLYR